MNDTGIGWKRAVGIALLSVCGACRGTDRTSESAAPAQSTAASENAGVPVNIPERQDSTGRETTAFSPRNLASWERVAPELRADATMSASGFEADRPDPWIIVGDSLGVTFDRSSSSMRTVRLRDGTERRTGRPGAGPLEFSPQSLVSRWRGDSALIRDAGQRRASVIALDHSGGRTFAYSAVDSTPRGDLLGQLRSGGLVFRAYQNFTQQGPPGAFRAPGSLRIVDPQSRSELGRASIIGPMAVRASIGEGRLLAAAPVSLASMVLVQPDRVLWIKGGTDSLFQLREGGPATLVARLALPQVELTAADTRNIVEEWLARHEKNPSFQKALRPYASVPSRLSALTATSDGEGGTAWLRLALGLEDEAGNVWVQMGADYSVAQCFRVPGGTTVLGFGRSVALIATESEVDGTFAVAVARLPGTCGSARTTSLRQ